jgi:beta-glucosidase/6-phospho-beta-glucosidase/beta-galactosidase/ABC-type amino acid transport substrate-binding protein
MPQLNQSSSSQQRPLLFGVATADHQCEAYDPAYRDIRDEWEERRHLTARGQATDFWSRYPEDISLAQSLGCKLFRFSLSWARLEPTPGAFNKAAFAHYQDVLTKIREAGMEPLMTLMHFTWPLHVEKAGGLTGTAFCENYLRYVKEVVEQFGPQVRYWITFNEPSQLIYGYVKPWWEQNYFMPPGLPADATMGEQMEQVNALMRNLFLAHTAARDVIKASNADAQVGVNPMILGLPSWLARFIDWNVTRLSNSNASKKRWKKQGQSYTSPPRLLVHGQADIILATVTVTRERGNDVDFSKVYFVAGQALLIPVKSSLTDISALAGKMVAVHKGSRAEQTLENLVPGAKALVVTSYEDGMIALDAGRAVALLEDDTILRGLMQQYPEKYRLLGDPLTKDYYAACITKGQPDLLKVIDEVIQRFKEPENWKVAFTKYFPAQLVPPIPSTFMRATLADISGRQADQKDKSLAAGSRHRTLLQQIKRRGRLVVGISDDIPGFGFRDPKTGEWSGIEVDLARSIAQEVLGSPDKVVFRPVALQERLSLVRSALHILDPWLKLFSILSTTLTSNWWHLGMAGKLPEFLCPSECVGKQDFVGFDYYWGISGLGLRRIQQLMNAAFGQYDNAPVWPGALYDMLKYHAQLFPGKDILIIENGSVDIADNIDRSQYLRQHISEVQRARKEGVQVIGYTCWSITSNREWGLPFGKGSDFGVYHIDLDGDPALVRHSTPAADTYREIIAQSTGVTS